MNNEHFNLYKDMKYVIVTVEWAASRGIMLTPEMRKSLDGSKVVLHEEMVKAYMAPEDREVTPLAEGDGMFRSYAFDDAEFRGILASEEWTGPEGEEQNPSHTSGYGVVAGLVNAEVAVKSGIQTMELTDEEASEVKSIYPEWESKMGQQVNVGEKYQYNGKLWKVLQQHTVQENWKPGEGTESLYTEVSKGHAGTKEDPIPYNNNMDLENGKYYSQDGVTYLCTRDTEIPVYQPLADLVGIYVEVSE